MRGDYRLGVVTNDIFTREDMEFLVRSEALPADRIIGVQTGGCPHTAIREDASMNFDAVDTLMARYPDLDVIFLESGGDNLAASFSPELVDASIYVIDVAGGDKIPRKGGPGITRSDLLVINKIDLAPFVGASLEVMERDSRRMRRGRPFVFTNLRNEEGLDAVATWLEETAAIEAAYCRRAYRLASEIERPGSLRDWAALLGRLGALKPARESREASATLGRRLFELAIRLDPAPRLLAGLDLARR